MNAAEGNVMDDTRLTRASEWFVRLRDTTLTTDEIAAWLTWCQEHPDNERAYRHVQEMWTLAGDAGVTDWPDAAQVRADTYDGDTPVGEWNARLAAGRKSEQWSGRNRLLLPVTAMAASLAVAVGLWTFRESWMPAPDSGVFSTDRGGQRTVRLADGSVVTLGGASTVRVDFHQNRRDVELEQGEAFFQVARDQTRPFVVRAQDLRVTAVGTAFAVRADDVRTVVSVTQGVVDVAPIGPTLTPAPGESSPGESTPVSGSAPMIGALEVQPGRVVRARAGERVTYDSSRRSSVLEASDIAMAIGWQEGALTYVDEPLRSVVARANRYSEREIVLAASIGELRFTGTIFENQIPEWAAGLERVFPIRTVVREDGSVVLEPR